MLATLKKEIRHQVLIKRDSLTTEERINLSRKICNNLMSLDEFKKADTVHFFLTIKSEVITEEAVRKSLMLGKDVVVPVTDRRQRRLLLSRLSDYDRDLMLMHHGIHEPRPEAIRHIDLKDVDLMVLPGVAFDQTGHRLGYGAGYYDRLLEAEHTRPVLTALAFELQMVDDIPVGLHDVQVDMIVTEDRVIRCKQCRPSGPA